MSPCFRRWLNYILSVAKMEQIHYGKRNSQNYFQKVWKLFLTMLNETYITHEF